MEAGDRNDKNLRLCRLLNDAVRKADHLAPADVPAKRMPSEREFLDALNRGPSLLAKLRTEVGPLKVVVMNGDSEFAPRRQ